MNTFQQTHNRNKESTSHITITAKKDSTETGYEIDIDYSVKSIKLKNKAGFIDFLPSSAVNVSFLGETYFLDIPKWLYNKKYTFFNS